MQKAMGFGGCESIPISSWVALQAEEVRLRGGATPWREPLGLRNYDARNAYGEAERADMVEGVEHIPGHAQYVRTFYDPDEPPELVFSSPSLGGGTAVLKSIQGTWQGDPLGPDLFAGGLKKTCIPHHFRSRRPRSRGVRGRLATR